LYIKFCERIAKRDKSLDYEGEKMKRWVVNVIQPQSRDAVTKPKSDVTEIAQSLGYGRISIRMQNTREMSDITLKALIEGIISEVERGDIVLHQFPTLLGFRFEEMFINCLKQKDTKIVVLMHDSEWLRGFYPKENDFLNSVDVVIGHGDKMNDALRNYGVRTDIVKKELFDYLQEKGVPLSHTLEKKAVVAGNLDKSIFIETWSGNMPELHAFGGKSTNNFGDNVVYHGSFIAQDLVEKIPKNYFGISWDDNLPRGGDYQGYTRFNSPHKVSLYLSLGMPVIVWEESAIAEFITKNHLGFTITTPNEIKEKFQSLSEKQLVEFKNNANKISKALRSGMFTRKAVIEAESIINGIENG